MTTDTGVVEIHGKSYFTVARRVQDFREVHPYYSITSEILSSGDVVQVKATIASETGLVIATGFAEEVRGSTNILKTSALETCETSAVGRALAFYGLGGSEIAGAEEIANALEQQKEAEAVELLKVHNAYLRDHIESIVAIKSYLFNDDYSSAYEAWEEVPADDRVALWIAPSKGGIFTTEERAKMKNDTWAAARKQYHGDK